MRFDRPLYLVEARRSPIGRFGGGLKTLSAADLALPVAEAVVAPALRERVDLVVLGQVLPAGAGMNVSRQVGLRLGLPETTPAFTVNMVCGSGLKAVALAASAIALGEADLVLAGGVEVMSRAPHYAADLRWGRKLGESGLADAIFVDGLTDPVLRLAMGETVERLAQRLGIAREAQDEFAARSQSRAAASRDAIRRELVPIATSAGEVAFDEHPRSDSTRERLAALKPAFQADGTVTAGNASGINDGAALVLVAGEAAVRKHGLVPRARIVGTASVGCDPAAMGLGPVGAVEKLCAELDWTLSGVESIEINEAFAAQTLACARALGLEDERLNRRGGAIALGHPIGCSGARILVTLLHGMEDDRLRRGIATLCIGGGMGIALAIERE